MYVWYTCVCVCVSIIPMHICIHMSVCTHMYIYICIGIIDTRHAISRKFFGGKTHNRLFLERAARYIIGSLSRIGYEENSDQPEYIFI